MQKRDLLNVCRSLLVMFAVVSLIAIAPGAAGGEWARSLCHRRRHNELGSGKLHRSWDPLR